MAKKDKRTGPLSGKRTKAKNGKRAAPNGLTDARSGKRANAENGERDEASVWRDRQIMINAMYKDFIEKEDDTILSVLDRHMVKGMKAMMEEDFDEAYRTIERMAREIMDLHAFAIADIDEERGVYRRIYSSHPDEFPVTDDMPLPEGGWTKAIVTERQMMSDNNLTATAAYFPDSAEGLAMGCQCICYMPVFEYMPMFEIKEDSEILGVLILLAKKNFFNRENMVALAEKLGHFWIYMDNLRLARTYGSSDLDLGYSEMMKKMLKLKSAFDH